jgi:hypothetical protein
MPFFVLLLLVQSSYASQSTITESEGYACMGDDKSRHQTEEAAMADAKRKAAEHAVSYLKSETHIKDMELEKDLVSAFTNGTVKVIQELEKAWYKDPAVGDCFKVRIKAEVVPDEKAIKAASKGNAASDDPALPLKVSVWTDKKEYRNSEKIRVYLKGNKPFYARVLYRDSKGTTLQLLPNPYRTENYFNGGVVYEIPSGNDRFELEVSPPFGEESVVVYAGTTELGNIEVVSSGAVYQVKTKTRSIGSMTRGVKLKEKTVGSGASASEFYEDTLSVSTVK